MAASAGLWTPVCVWRGRAGSAVRNCKNTHTCYVSEVQNTVLSSSLSVCVPSWRRWSVWPAPWGRAFGRVTWTAADRWESSSALNTGQTHTHQQNLSQYESEMNFYVKKLYLHKHFWTVCLVMLKTQKINLGCKTSRSKCSAVIDTFYAFSCFIMHFYLHFYPCI